MAKRLRIANPDLSKSERTFLDADYVTSATTLTVVNNFGFAANDIVIAGNPGEEKSESQPVSSYTGNTTITLTAALDFAHNKGTIIYRFEYDQIEISRYRSGTWTLISTSDIQWDKRETIYIDANGVSTDSYKYRLINSISGASSGYSPNISGAGFDRGQVGYMISEVRRVAGDEEKKIISDAEILRQFNRAQDIIKARRNDWWFLRKTSSGQITTTINTRTYGLNTYLSDMNYIDTVRYRYDDGTTDNTYHLENITSLEMDYEVRDNDATTDDWPSYYVIEPPDSTDATGYISIDKKTKTTGYGKFYIRYFKKMTDLSTIISTTDVPLPSILEDFAVAYIFKIKGDETKAEIYSKQFYGPQPKEERYQEPTGLRLLEIMQSSKGKAIGQPKALKTFRGRKVMTKYFKDHTVDADSIRERYY